MNAAVTAGLIAGYGAYKTYRGAQKVYRGVKRAGNWAYNNPRKSIALAYGASEMAPTPRGRRTTRTPSSRRSMSVSSRRSRSSPSGSVFNPTFKQRMIAAVAENKRNRIISRKGASTSKSAGFFGRSKVARRTKRHSRRNYKGVSLVTELGGVVDSAVNNGSDPVVAQSKLFGNTIAIGHMTMPYETVLKMACRAIVKQLMISAGDGELANFDAPIPQISDQDIVELKYYFNPDSADIQTHNFPLVLDGAILTYDGLAQVIANWISANATSEWVFKYLSYVPIAVVTPTFVLTGSRRNYTTLNLSGCSLSFYSKSTLKIQNRTVNTATGDEESVDNVPIYGRSYEGGGSGTGAITRDKKGTVSAARDFVGDDKYGAIAKVPSEKWYQEVPRADQFLKVKSDAKVHLDPGQVKTSRLISRLNVTFDRLITELLKYNYATVGRSHGMHAFGHFRFMMFEKMLNSVAGTTVNSMKIAYETNLFISCTAKIKRNYQTAQLNDVYNLAAEA